MAKHELAVERAISTRVEAPGLDFSAVYAAHFSEVCRWLRAMGGPEADLEDLAQDVFLVVRRRLPEFDGGNMRGWLYRIARNMAGDYRRRLFFRQLFHKRYEDSFDETWDVGDAPDRRYEEREARRTVTRVLARMGAKKRTVFVLFEIEGYSSEEIGRLEGIPEATVRTRLFHARREFRALLQRMSPLSDAAATAGAPGATATTGTPATVDARAAAAGTSLARGSPVVQRPGPVSPGQSSRQSIVESEIQQNRPAAPQAADSQEKDQEKTR